jgi:hypothetical protein
MNSSKVTNICLTLNNVHIIGIGHEFYLAKSDQKSSKKMQLVVWNNFSLAPFFVFFIGGSSKNSFYEAKDLHLVIRAQKLQHRLSFE